MDSSTLIKKKKILLNIK